MVNVLSKLERPIVVIFWLLNSLHHHYQNFSLHDLLVVILELKARNQNEKHCETDWPVHVTKKILVKRRTLTPRVIIRASSMSCKATIFMRTMSIVTLQEVRGASMFFPIGTTTD